MQEINREVLAEQIERELALFRERTPESRRLTEEAKSTMPGSVPMPWMSEWHTPYPLFNREAKGSKLIDVDGNEYLDLRPLVPLTVQFQ